MSNLRKTLFLLLSFAFLSGCSDETASSQNQAMNSGDQLELKLNGLEPMQGQHYEGWVVGSNGVSSTGRFNIDSQGQVVSVDSDGQMLAVIGQNNTADFSLQDPASTVSVFVLTIEPDGDTDDGPSAIHYLEGDFVNGKAMATLEAGGAIGTSFLNSLGSFILATPSNGPSTHNQGIWYLDAGNPSLQIPALNTGWIYEGWIVNTQTGDVISTGLFNGASGEDSDGAGSTAGPNPTPAYPGQDFITPARILNDGNHMAVISVEPFPDFDPAPFTLKVLGQPIASGAAVTTSIDMGNISNEASLYIEATLKSSN